MQDSYSIRLLCFNIHIHEFISPLQLSDRPSFIHPRIDEFRGIRVNFVFMNGLRPPVCVSTETI